MEATLIYPHQLFKKHPAIAGGRRIYLVEEPLILTHNPTHRQKLILHKLTMDAYERHLTSNGFEVTRLRIGAHPITKEVFKTLKQDGVTKLHIADTTDFYLEKAIVESGLERVWYESPLFILSRDEAVSRFCASNRLLAQFYKALRKDKNILIDADGEPTGGSWSFDADNRKTLPKDLTLPEDIKITSNMEVSSATQWAEQVPAEQYGEPGCWLPYTHDEAEAYLANFLKTRFAEFGPYEDAITTQHTRLFHSAISPLLNIGLLTPQAVLDQTLEYASTHQTPIQSLEGFVRQILGWREFIRASYEVDGSKLRNENFFAHDRMLSKDFWTGTTNILPIDHTIKTALQYGYTHHIERLMVTGNFMLLSHIHPDEVYKWFMGMYIDAYDWVMVPNVYAMSQYADGGSFATKPYISGANYLKKMSDYPKGDWEELWTSLYWNFIDTHHDVFTKNPRLSMMPRLWDDMDENKKQDHRARAKAYLTNF